MTADWTEIEATTRGGRRVSLRFAAEEYAERLARFRAELNRRGLAALLIFAQESHYWLTGFDSAGYVLFQAGVIPADDRGTVLLTRIPDRRQAEVASLYDEVRVWVNAPDARPAEELRAILAELGCAGAKVGVEFASYGLTAANPDISPSGGASGFRIGESSSATKRYGDAGELPDADGV